MSSTTFGPSRKAIVKVQLNTPIRVDSVARVYDKDGKHRVSQPVTQKTRDALKGDTRAFFEGTFNDDGYWELGKRLPEQFW